MDLAAYRASQAEQARTRDLLRLTPASGAVALDVGARDGHFSRLLAERFGRVIALDLSRPDIDHPRVECVAGNACDLALEDDSVDFVFCAEVLEHVPTPMLARACGELERVCRGTLLIGVPYRQDLRVGRTTCGTCQRTNPPWGHVNRFDEGTLAALFPRCRVGSVSFVGETSEGTNALSAWLMDLAGNPYGTYNQEEPCVHCGHRLLPPPPRTLPRKVLTRLGIWARDAGSLGRQPRGNWIHMALHRHPAA